MKQIEPQYTKEPWVLVSNVWIRNWHGSPVVMKDMPITRSDAERIVACVNACRGMANPQVFKEILEAVKKLLKVSEKNPFSSVGHIIEHGNLGLGELVAKVKGG